MTPARFFRRTSGGHLLFVLAATLLATGWIRAEDGYRLWLRYDRVDDNAYLATAVGALEEIVLSTGTGTESPTLSAARDELSTGLEGLLGLKPRIVVAKNSSVVANAGDEGYSLRSLPRGNGHSMVISANHDVGVLYGAFALLRLVNTRQFALPLEVASAPRIQRRVLDHWDNLNRTVERGYAGQSLWNWFDLPEVVDPRYRDYARADASVGINGVVLANVNADALVLTSAYLQKVTALANVFRPYGIQVYLPARFSAPVEIGGLASADPLDAGVAKWWRAMADEIYRQIPDFGGFVVKANSEGQPGPQQYGRTHADGANLLADAVAPHGGIVMWRAFVYDSNVPDDRAKQAYNEFYPLDGKFRANVVIQIKNGPIDFMPREPFHPLFGAMPHTALALELQLTQEYLGGSIQLAYLAPLFKEALDSDTFASGAGSTVGRIVDGSLDRHELSAIAGVANIGTDRNWCGHPLASANWYAFGRLAWDHDLGADVIANEWIRQVFSPDETVVHSVAGMLLESREAVVNYSMPLGLHHIMAYDHHYGPGPWVDQGARPDWNSVYYHRADATGLGFDRTATGSNAVGLYAPEAARRWSDLTTCPDELLLWFHHVPWSYTMRSGRTMWDELCLHYQRGVDAVRQWETSWDKLAGRIDAERFGAVLMRLRRQEHDARDWRDACLLYFQGFSKRPLPAGVEQPAHPLDYYNAIELHYVPGTPSGK